MYCDWVIGVIEKLPFTNILHLYQECIQTQISIHKNVQIETNPCIYWYVSLLSCLNSASKWKQKEYSHFRLFTRFTDISSPSVHDGHSNTLKAGVPRYATAKSKLFHAKSKNCRPKHSLVICRTIFLFRKPWCLHLCPSGLKKNRVIY